MAPRSSARNSGVPPQSEGQKLQEKWRLEIGNEGDSVMLTFPSEMWNKDHDIPLHMKQKECKCPAVDFTPTGDYTHGELPRIKEYTVMSNGHDCLITICIPPMEKVPISFQDGTSDTVKIGACTYKLNEKHVAEWKVQRFSTVPERDLASDAAPTRIIAVEAPEAHNGLWEDITVTLCESNNSHYTIDGDTLCYSPKGWYLATVLNQEENTLSGPQVTQKALSRWFYWNGDSIDQDTVLPDMPRNIACWYVLPGFMVSVHVIFIAWHTLTNHTPFLELLLWIFWEDWLFLAGIAFPWILGAFYHLNPNKYTTHNSLFWKVVKSLLHIALVMVLVDNLTWMYQLFNGIFDL